MCSVMEQTALPMLKSVSAVYHRPCPEFRIASMNISEQTILDKTLRLTIVISESAIMINQHRHIVTLSTFDNPLTVCNIQSDRLLQHHKTRFVCNNILHCTKMRLLTDADRHNVGVTF